MSDLPLRRDTAESPSNALTPTDYAARGISLFEDGSEYASVVVPADGHPDECTIFPVDASEAELVTTWISAEAGSFVALAEMR